jgi:hypothetical protein
MHPFVATAMANQIVLDRREAARHVRATRRRHRRAAVRRVISGR